MKYLGIAFLIGIVSGVTHNIILFRHVVPYMRGRGAEPTGPLHLNRIVSEYLKIDDPEERNIKMVLKCLKIPFLIAFLIAVFGLYMVARTYAGE